MSLYFTNCEISVAGSSILAESATLSSSNSVNGVPFIGYKDNSTKFPNGAIQSNFNLSYILETQNEPIYNIVQFLRTGVDNFNFSPTTIVAGSITGFFYLQNYKLNLESNQIIKANATFVGYTENSGFYEGKNVSYTGVSVANGNRISFIKYLADDLS